MSRITKKDLIAHVSNSTGITHKDVAEVIDAFLDAVSKQLSDGREIALRDFGTLGLRVSRRSVGRNPLQPDVPIAIPDRMVVRFQPGNKLREAVAKLPVPPRGK